MKDPANIAEALAAMGERALKEGYTGAVVALTKDNPDRPSLMVVTIDLRHIPTVSGYLTMAQRQVLDGEFSPVKTQE